MTKIIDPDQPTPAKLCHRTGCQQPVKKRTAKYCSVRCCALDPERQERIRRQARACSRQAILPLAHQMTLNLGNNPEAQIASFARQREDIPGGLSRLAG